MYIRLIRIQLTVITALVCLGLLHTNASAQVTLEGGKLRFGEELVEFLPLTEAISEMYKVNIIFGEKVKAKDKLHVLFPDGIEKKDAWKFFVYALDMMGITYYKVNKYHKFVSEAEMPRTPCDLFIDKFPKVDQQNPHISFLYRPKHLPVEEAVKLVEKFKAKEGSVVQFDDALLYIDWQHNIPRTLGILNALDVGDNKTVVYIWKAANSNVTDVAQIVEKLFTKAGSDRKSSAVGIESILADERSDQLIIAGTEEGCKKVLQLLPKLDVPITRDEEMEIVYLKAQKAQDLASTLQGIVSQKSSGKKKGKHKFNQDLEVKISANEQYNALLLIGPRSGIRELKQVIAKLDHLQQQVMLEVIVMEVTLTDSEKMGVSLAGGKKLSALDAILMGSSSYAGLSAVQLNPASLMGMAVGAQGPAIEGSGDAYGLDSDLPSFGAVIQALQSDANVNLLSNPYLMGADGEEAEIIVGSNVPYITGTSRDRNNMPILSIQRQDIGLSVKMKPEINEDNNVRIELEVNIEDLLGISETMGPTTSKRSLKTTVISSNGGHVALGGLTRDRKIADAEKIPGAGDVPLLGRIFKSDKSSTEKVSLILFITPHIITSTEELKRIFKKKIKERSEFVKEMYGEEKEDYDINIDLHDRTGLVEGIRKEIEEQQNADTGEEKEKYIIIGPDGIEPLEEEQQELEVETGE